MVDILPRCSRLAAIPITADAAAPGIAHVVKERIAFSKKTRNQKEILAKFILKSARRRKNAHILISTKENKNTPRLVLTGNRCLSGAIRRCFSFIRRK
ncbi:hypothetical protein HUU40_15255 [candidate division KSB1 bacterium]|nr:hypothetical protein [candidate division KSB1 bacterium]